MRIRHPQGALAEIARSLKYGFIVGRSGDGAWRSVAAIVDWYEMLATVAGAQR
jgi:hypothetical protein